MKFEIILPFEVFIFLSSGEPNEVHSTEMGRATHTWKLREVERKVNLNQHKFQTKKKKRKEKKNQYKFEVPGS